MGGWGLSSGLIYGINPSKYSSNFSSVKKCLSA